MTETSITAPAIGAVTVATPPRRSRTPCVSTVVGMVPKMPHNRAVSRTRPTAASATQAAAWHPHELVELLGRGQAVQGLFAEDLSGHAVPTHQGLLPSRNSPTDVSAAYSTPAARANRSESPPPRAQGARPIAVAARYIVW